MIFSLRGPTRNSIKGGARNYIEEFAGVLVESGYNVTILCGEEKDFKMPQEEVLRNGVKIIRIPVKFGFISLMKFFNKNFKKKDHFIIENMVSYPLMTPLIGADVTIIHHLPGKEYIRSQGYLKGMAGMFMEYILFPILYRNKVSITVSELSKKEISSRGIRNDQIKIIPPIINGLNGSQRKIDLNRGNIISYIGRYDGPNSVKRVMDIIEILPGLVKEIPDLKLILAGSMRRKDLLDQRIKQLKLEDYVESKGFISEEEKAEILSSSKIFVSPSYQEGFGITYIEANSFSTPVAGYEIEGLDTVPSTAGVFVPKDDKITLQEEVLNLLKDGHYWETKAKGAYINSQRFSKVNIQKDILSLVEGRILKENN